MRTGLPRRIVLPAALFTVAVIAAPAACLFPDYTFDLRATSSSSGSGGGGASSTTTSTTTTTTTSSGGGTGGTPPCQVVDCSDPTCSDYECVDVIPTGWAVPGYVALYEGATGQSPPDCTAAQPTTVYMGNGVLDFLPADCTPCGCGAPTGQDCQLVTDLSQTSAGLQPMQVSNLACNVPATALSLLTVPSPWGGACFFDEALPGGQMCAGSPCNTSVQSTAPQVMGGTCAATGGTVAADTAMPSWSVTAKACFGMTQGKGCTGTQACVPKPPNPFKSQVCISQSGDVACPAGSSFSNKSVYYQGFDDARSCSGCNCGTPSGGSCGITITLYSDTTTGTCDTVAASFKAGGCANITDGGGNPTNPGIYGRTDAITTPPNGATCTPVTSTTPTGSVTATMPTTFCCL